MSQPCMIQWLDDQSYSLVCKSNSDDCIQWQVIAYHMSQPQERCYGFGDTAKEAVAMAIHHVQAHGDYAPPVWEVES